MNQELTHWVLRLDCGHEKQEGHDPRADPLFSARYCHRCRKVVGVATAQQKSG